MSKMDMSTVQRDRMFQIIQNIDQIHCISDLEELFDSPILLDDLKNVLKRLKYMRKNYTDLSKYYYHICDFLESQRMKDKESETKMMIKKVNRLKKSFLESEDLLEKNHQQENTDDSVKQSIIRHILMLDYYYDDLDEEIFQQYLQEDDFEKRMDILVSLRNQYFNTTILLYKEKKNTIHQVYRIIARDFSLGQNYKKNKKLFDDILGREEYCDLRNMIDQARKKYRKNQIFLSQLERLIDFEKNQQKNLFPKKDLDDSETDYEELIDCCIPFYREYIQRLKDIKYGRYSRKYKLQLKNFIPDELERLFEKLSELDEDKLLELCILGEDVCKNKLRNLKYGVNDYDDCERDFLKKIIHKFESLKPIDPFCEEDDTQIYYTMLCQLIDDDRNYSYLEHLITQISGFRNARGRDGHILLLLVDKFIFNYKLKLANQGFLYTDPKFYQEVIKLYLQFDGILNQEETIQFYRRLDEFEEYCQKKKYKDIHCVISDLGEIRNPDSIKDDCFDQDKVQMELNAIFGYRFDDVVRHYLLKGNSFYRDGFMFDQIGNLAFSLEYTDEGDSIFSVHLLDNSKVIDFDDEIVKSSFTNQNFMPKLCADREYPVISFSYRLLGKNGKIAPVSIHPSVLRIENVYGEDDLDQYRECDQIKNMYCFLHSFNDFSMDFSLYDQKEIELVVSNKVSNDLAKRFSDSKIPFIYEVHSDQSLDLVQKNHNAVCYELSKVPIREAHQIFHILDQVNDQYYMPVYRDGSKICLDSSQLSGLYLEHVLNRIFVSKYDVMEEALIVDECIHLLNEKKGYLPEGIQIEGNRKLKRMVFEYKKKNRS